MPTMHLDRNAIPKDARKVVLRLLEQGCTGRTTGSGHLLLVAPTGDRYTLAGTSCNRRVLANIRSWARRNGLEA